VPHREETAAFFGDFDLVEPGVVYLPRWRPDARASRTSGNLANTPELFRRCRPEARMTA
jgi:hypothetical protein